MLPQTIRETTIRIFRLKSPDGKTFRVDAGLQRKNTRKVEKQKTAHIFDLSGLSPPSFFDPKGLSTSLRKVTIGIHKIKYQNQITKPFGLMLAFSAGTPERLKIESQHIFDLSGLYPPSFFDPKGLSISSIGSK
ncbi:MAG: hypothetical protein K8R74_04830 [Bacteroidales bacterium]|nr:hypothetical protein [Bacteroidales bacterium]